MKRHVAIVLGALGAFVLAGGLSYGSGYSIYEQGAAAMANAGAFTARANDPSALFFNPAGILQLDGVQVSLGTTPVLLTGSEFDSSLSSGPFTGGTFSQTDNVAWPSNFYLTQKINKKKLAWGFGVTSPFGLKTEWGPTFDGRYISREANLAVVNLGGHVAFGLGDNWAVAVGVDYAKADIRELSKNIDFSAFGQPDGFTKLTGNGSDFGYDLSVRWAQGWHSRTSTLTSGSKQGWSWGLTYRSEMKPKIDGDVQFENIPGILAAAFPNGGATAVIPLPATAQTGVGKVGDKWEWEFDVVWTDWSVFDRLQIDIEKETIFMGFPAVTDIDQTEEWKTTYSYRAGATYHVSDSQRIRFGGYYDTNPVPDEHVRPRLPDADRTSAQIGYGFASKKGFTFDIAYQALFFADRNAVGSPNSGLGPLAPQGSGPDPVQPGTYTNFTSLIGFNVGWKFGQ